MGRIFHHFEPLPFPFRLIDERVITIPPKSKLVVNNQFFKILIIFEGAMTMQVEDGPAYPIQEGDILVIPHHCKHDYIPANPKHETRLHVARIIFDDALLEELPNAGSWPDPGVLAVMLKKNFPRVCLFRDPENAGIIELVNRALQEVELSKIGFRLNTYGCLLQAITELLRLTREEPSGLPLKTHDRANQIVNQTEGYLLDNFSRSIHLRDVARHLNLSEEHLARVFRGITGETISERLRRLRIEKARRLLLSGNDSLSSIARACGFTSLAVFSVNFKKATGTSPGQFRRNNSPQIKHLASSLSSL